MYQSRIILLIAIDNPSRSQAVRIEADFSWNCDDNQNHVQPKQTTIAWNIGQEQSKRNTERHGPLAHCTFKCALILIHTVFAGQNVALLKKLDGQREWQKERKRERWDRALFHRGDTYFLISRAIAAERASVNCIWELRSRAQHA